MTNEVKETLLLGYRAKVAGMQAQIKAMSETIAGIEADLRGKSVVKRGRKPAAVQAKGKRKMSPEGRERIAAAQRARWAKKAAAEA